MTLLLHFRLIIPFSSAIIPNREVFHTKGEGLLQCSLFLRMNRGLEDTFYWQAFFPPYTTIYQVKKFVYKRTCAFDTCGVVLSGSKLAPTQNLLAIGNWTTIDCQALCHVCFCLQNINYHQWPICLRFTVYYLYVCFVLMLGGAATLNIHLMLLISGNRDCKFGDGVKPLSHPWHCFS